MIWFIASIVFVVLVAGWLTWLLAPLHDPNKPGPLSGGPR